MYHIYSYKRVYDFASEKDIVWQRIVYQWNSHYRNMVKHSLKYILFFNRYFKVR